MSENQISSFLTIVLIALSVILLTLFAVFIILSMKERNRNKKREEEQKSGSENENQNVKKDVEYTKFSIFDFMDFDKIDDNMIIRKNGKRYIMVIECQGVNYDLMSGLEKNSVEQGFLQFLNTLRYPIQLYVQTRTVNLGSSITRYKQKVNEIRNDYMRKQMEYNSIVNSEAYSLREINNAKFELVKAQNLYEYGLDIINNTERMNLNKNILKKHYYVIIGYTPEENTNVYDKEEVKSMAFSDLYTKAQALISSLGVCNVTGKVLNSEELAELLYVAYNRDEAEVYELDKALRAGIDEMYSVGKDVLDKRMQEINAEIEAQANIKANDVALEAMANQEKIRKVKQREQRMNELIDEMAKDLLDENEQLLGSDIVKDAKEIIDQKTKETQKTKKAQKAQ